MSYWQVTILNDKTEPVYGSPRMESNGFDDIGKELNAIKATSHTIKYESNLVVGLRHQLGRFSKALFGPKALTLAAAAGKNPIERRRKKETIQRSAEESVAAKIP